MVVMAMRGIPNGLRSVCRANWGDARVSRSVRGLNGAWRLQAWGADVSWHGAIVSSTVDGGVGLKELTVEVPEAVTQDYGKPGQFVQVRTTEADKPAFMAVANPPGGSSVELLVKATEGTAGSLCGLTTGDALEVSGVMGKGFRMDELPPESFPVVFLFATGTGIAPIRSLIEGEGRFSLQPAARKRVVLFYGAKDEAHSAYETRLSGWEKCGIEVVRVMSQAEEGWTGVQGYVQEAFRADVENYMASAAPEGTAVVLCGQKEMCEEITALVTELGVPAENIHLNF